MVNDPKKFFNDSRYELLKNIGETLYVDYPMASVNKEFKRVTHEVPVSLIKDEVLYPQLGSNILLIKTGIDFLDENRILHFIDRGFDVQFYDLTELDELDDIEYRSKKSVSEFTNQSDRLVDACVDLDISCVVFPYDSTEMMGGLALDVRGMGVKTLTYLLPLEPVIRKYEELSCVFIADYVLVDPEFSSLLSSSSCSEKLYGVSCASNLSIKKNSKYRLGISPSNNVVVFFAPALHLGVSVAECESTVARILAVMKPLIDDNSHLVVVLKDKKGGFLGKKYDELFKKFHRVTKLSYAKSSLVSGLLSEAIIFAPSGLLRTGDFVLKEYSLDNTKVKLNRFSKVNWRSIPPTVNTSIKAILNEFDAPFLDVSENGMRKVAVPDPIDNKVITDGRQKYLLELLNAQERLYGAGPIGDILDASCFVQWGAEPNEPKSRPEKNRIALKRPKLYLEDGFIRSLDLWTDPNVPTLSVVMDTQAIYYDSLSPSLLEKILNSDFKIASNEFDRASKAIGKIVNNKISKYNYAPKLELPIRDGRKNILLVDQKAGDMSIKYGMSDASTFDNMLDDALALSETHDVYIKLHPIAISEGGNAAHYTFERLGEIVERENVFVIGFDINPYSLIEPMDEVWVVSSGMGFEALLAGKQVRCFGVPFYSNWGLTIDYQLLNRRSVDRGLEEIFYVFYIMLTRYVDPVMHKSCELEDLIEYFERVLVKGTNHELKAEGVA